MRVIGEGENRRTECTGTFTPADGSPTRTVHLPSESDEGETFKAVLTGDRAHRSDLSGRLGALTLPALGFLFLVPLPWGVAYLLFDHIPGRVSRYTMGAFAAASGGLCLAGLLASTF